MNRIKSSAKKPRLSVHKSNKYLNVQIIDDEKGTTLLGVSEKNLKIEKGTKTQKAQTLGKEIAAKAASLKIKSVIFDRGRNRYHGRVKALADGLREGGLNF